MSGLRDRLHHMYSLHTEKKWQTRHPHEICRALASETNISTYQKS